MALVCISLMISDFCFVLFFGGEVTRFIYFFISIFRGGAGD